MRKRTIPEPIPGASPFRGLTTFTFNAILPTVAPQNPIMTAS